MINGDLPAYLIASDVNRHLKEGACLVVTAPPGAGKSTVLPLTILHGMEEWSGADGGRIIMLEPRRLAARAVAERMAHVLGEKVGETVGYRVRFEKCVTEMTRIEVVTEGILTRMLIDDPTLEGVSVVIFDEFHERSIHSDTALVLAREAQQVLRPDLRIVVMSATIDAATICSHLSSGGTAAPLVQSDGRMYPVEIVRADDSATADNCVEMAADAVREVIDRHREGDVLVFLPGEGEIRRCGELLSRHLSDRGINLCMLFGMLSLAEQHRAIAPSQPGERKVVLSTNIAETSLTIEGVRIVIDSGLQRKMVFDAQSGLSRLTTVPISLDMATQRSGRAGRVASGMCYRLWTMATEHRMAEQRAAEILEADLAPMLLDLAAWGETDAERLPWLTMPPKAALLQAAHLLEDLGALDHGHLTPQGRRLAALPCHPRLASMLLRGTSDEEKALAADVAALLEERDIMVQHADDADLCSRLELFRRQRQRFPRVARISEQYCRMIHAAPSASAPDAYAVGALVAAAYPERIAKAHQDGCGRFLMASGQVVRVEHTDALSAYEWLAVASFNAASGRIFLAAPIAPADLASFARQRDNLSWDFKQGCLVARREERIGQLVLRSRPLDDVPREAVVQVICDAVRRRGESLLDFAADAVVGLQQRVAAVAAWHPDQSWPDLSTAAVIERVEEWLPYYLGDATTSAQLKRIDLAAALTSLLSYDQQQELDRLAPTHISVPTGSRIRLEYRPAAAVDDTGSLISQPVLRVRLQECFGMEDTPRLDDGRQPVLMELLSPGFKPVQLTQDLHSFWTSTYFDVRKELRRRYPKHHWPDNPLEAEAVRGVKRKPS